jgi:hypothetical protein
MHYNTTPQNYRHSIATNVHVKFKSKLTYVLALLM